MNSGVFLNSMNLRFYAFLSELTVVPEPSAVTLLMGDGVLALTHRRFHKGCNSFHFEREIRNRIPLHSRIVRFFERVRFAASHSLTSITLAIETGWLSAFTQKLEWRNWQTRQT